VGVPFVESIQLNFVTLGLDPRIARFGRSSRIALTLGVAIRDNPLRMHSVAKGLLEGATSC